MQPSEALTHAIIAHDGEYDRCNLPAVLHPIEVVHNLRSINPMSFDIQFVIDGRVVGYLHDVLEDTSYPKERLANLTDKQAVALDCITHRDNESYHQYIERVADNKIASYVKLADLCTNLHRQPGHGETEDRIAQRRIRYLAAREYLWDAIDERWWPDNV